MTIRVQIDDNSEYFYSKQEAIEYIEYYGGEDSEESEERVRYFDNNVNYNLERIMLYKNLPGYQESLSEAKSQGFKIDYELKTCTALVKKPKDST